MPLIRTAVIGAGRWGNNLIRNIAESDRFELAAVCDVNPTTTTEFKKVPRFQTIDELFCQTELDAVVIATPPQTHGDLVETALQAGKHVLCEKPLAMDFEVCRRLGELANAQGLCLMVDCTPVYLEEIQRAREEIRWDEVNAIQCQRISSRRPRHSIHPRWDLAPHDLAVIDYWLGDLPSHWIFRSFAAGMQFRSLNENRVSIEVLVGYGPHSIREIKVFSKRGLQVFQQDQCDPEPLRTVTHRFANSIRDGTVPVTDFRQAARIAEILSGAGCAAVYAD